MSKWLQESQEKASSLEAERDQLKAENERLASMLNQVVAEGILMADERDTLRTQLDEAMELLEMSRHYVMRVDDNAAVDAWLEANKK